ncbi:MAG: hypothetical protein ACPK85_05555 [Methanosarcina sp.]
MKKSLKISFYTFLTLAILTFICIFLIFSSPFFMNLYASTLIEYSGVDHDNIYFQAYTKEEFALKYFNTTLSPEDDFIELFENHYGTQNKKDGLFLITYDIQEPGDRTRYTLYGINKYTHLVYKDTRKVCYTDSEANSIPERRNST